MHLSIASLQQIIIIIVALIRIHYFCYRESIADIDWSVAHSSFPLLVQLLVLKSYTYHTILGMIASVGGLTESTVSV